MFQQMIIPVNYKNTRKYYPTNEELIHDIGVAYQEVIRQFYDAGCRNLQLDDCTWGAIVGDAAKQRSWNMMMRDPVDLHRWQKYLRIKKVVLGLITTKSPELEDKERVIHRINEAAKYVPLERLYLSPQCGFASCEIGNKLTEEQQWEKIKTGERDRRRSMG